jgi:hypothetical protein
MRRSTVPRPQRRIVQGPRPAPSLPRSVASLFWDYPGRRLSLARDRELVVRRILAEGGLLHVRYIRRRVGDDVIRDVLQRSQARGLSPQRIRFWQLLLDVPVPLANAWVRSARAGTWARRRRA